jgi:hypothetical protein
MRRSFRAMLALSLSAIAVSCADPVHDNAVDALGGEVPGVPPGPLHRPGQPCLTCHGGEGPGSPTFSVGGTVFSALRGGSPVPGAAVQFEDFAGVTGTVITNEAGNFYITPRQWTPTYPFETSVVLGNVTKQMQTHVGRSGSCADCHVDPPSPSSPGDVYIGATQ